MKKMFMLFGLLGVFALVSCSPGQPPIPPDSQVDPDPQDVADGLYGDEYTVDVEETIQSL